VYATLAFQTNISAPPVLRVISQTVREGFFLSVRQGRHMIAEPIEPKASKVGQALAIGFITFLVIISAWELLATRL
jgi:hypothetical protein